MSSLPFPKWEAMGGCECLDWGPLQPAATLVTVPVPPGTSPAFEDEVVWSDSGLSPWCSPEPLCKGDYSLSLAAVFSLPSPSSCIPYSSPTLWYCQSFSTAAFLLQLRLLFLSQYMKEVIWPFSSSSGAAGIQTMYFPLWILWLLWKLLSAR